MDHVLLNCLKLVLRRYEKYGNECFGLVGAAIVTDEYDTVYETAIQSISGKWKHAEHTVINKFHLLYGDLPNSAILVTTLSPCFVHMDDRFGESCSELISDTGIQTVYTGIDDRTQLTYDPDHYNDVPFELIVTDNKDLRYICELLMKKISTVQDISKN